MLLLLVVCILKYIYIQPAQSVQCHLSVCFQGSLVLGNQLEAAGVHLPGKHYFSSSHQSLVACSFFYFRLRLHELFPFCMSTSVDTIFVQVMFRQPCWGDFMGIASDVSKRDNLTATFTILLLRLLKWFLNLRCRNCVVDVGVQLEWTGSLVHCILTSYVIVSIYWKAKFPWRRVRTYLWVHG